MSTSYAPAATPGDTHPERWRMLAILSVAELLGMSLWDALRFDPHTSAKILSF